MRVAVQPVGYVIVRQPPPPADCKGRLHDIFDDGARDVDESPGGKDKEEQLPEIVRILLLDGVEPIAVEERETNGDADLRLIDEHKKNDHRHGKTPLQRSKRAKRPDARLRFVACIEIAVGDPGYVANDRDM